MYYLGKAKMKLTGIVRKVEELEFRLYSTIYFQIYKNLYKTTMYKQ